MVAERNIHLDEARLLMKAAEELARDNATAVRCPRCGGKLHLDWFGAGSSYLLSCETDGCVELTSRGI